MRNQVAIVTGGSRGIGREIALQFAREGCRIAVTARDEKALKETAASIKTETGSDAILFPLDIRDVSAVDAMVRGVNKRFNKIDILVNAAAVVGPIGPFEKTDQDGWEQTFSVNVLGTYTVCQAVLPTMIRQKRGAIINFAGGGAFGARERFGAYSVSKAAVVRLTDVMALELKQHGISVNAISPGQVNTEMFDAMVAAGPDKVGEKGWAEFEKRKKTGGDPIDAVGRLARFLVSDDGRKITGRTISVQWDPWEKFPEHLDELNASDIYSMRRIKPEDYGKHW